MVSAFLVSLLSAAIATGVELYSYPALVEKSAEYSVSIAGQDVTVLSTDHAQIAQLGADGEVELAVNYLGGELRYAAIRPVEKGYEYEIEGNTLRVRLKTYDRVSVEINGDTRKPLFIFVNPLEEPVAASLKNKTSILYFKAGNIYPLKRLDLKDYEGIYIEGGAIVRASLVGTELSGLKIGGCGILDCRAEGGNACKLSSCSRISMDNLLILNKGMAACLMLDCSDVSMDNVKAVNVESGSTNNERPAFDWAGCKKVCSRRLFAYSQSKALAIHNKYADLCLPSQDFLIEDCVAWNVQTASTLSINCSDDTSISDIRVHGFYAIHSAGKPKPYYRAVLSIQQSGSKKVGGLEFSDIVAENPGEYLFCMSGWITDVSFTSVKAYSKAPFGSILRGADFDHRVENVTFREFSVGKKKIRNLKQAGVKNPLLGLNIVFE